MPEEDVFHFVVPRFDNYMLRSVHFPHKMREGKKKACILHSKHFIVWYNSHCGFWSVCVFKRHFTGVENTDTIVHGKKVKGIFIILYF